MDSTVIHPYLYSLTAMRGGTGGKGRKHAGSPDSEALENTPRLPPSDAEDEDSETMISDTPPQLSHRDHEDMLVYADPDYEDEEGEEEDEEEDAIELLVETLTGDSYRVRVSQWDTAASLKDLLYRTQGIHPGYQHLIHRDRELVDDACLIDQQVMDGSTLRLILAIRGGPVNARRLPTHEDILLRDLTDQLDSNSQRQGVGQTLTFLVFHDDENMNVNVYRVVENRDGSYSPLNESWGSVGSGHGGADEAATHKTHLTEEEKRTMARMADLRTEMDKLRLRNKKKKKERMKAGGVSSTQTSLNSSLRSMAGRLEEAITPRLDLTDISGVSTATTTASVGGGGTLTTPRKRSPVKRLAGIRRGSRPTTQERMELMKSSHGRATLRELPTANAPVPVDFTRRKPLEAIRPQLVRGRLEAVDEMLGRGENTPEHVVRRSPPQQEAWPTREAPKPPLYMLPEISSRKHRRYDQDRLNHSHNQELLRPMRHTAGRRPKTSPEVLERRPGGLPDGTGERVLLRGTDDRLRELCSILEPVRGDSSHSQRLNSSMEATLPPLDLSTSYAGPIHNPPPPRTYRSNSVSVSLASLRTRGATPPSPGQGALVTSGSREQRDALRGLISGASRPGSARMLPHHAPLPPPPVPAPAVLPPVTPKRRKGRRKPRCEKCSRRIGVSSTYECRCGGIFCAQHRYSETHSCSFDYRTAGRAMLAMANPLVAPNRVPKI